MSTTRFSVVVPCYKVAGRRFLAEQCLASLAAQTFTDFELVVVDDGSADGSAALLREILSAHPALASRAQVIPLPQNGGVCRARNAGIDASTGEFVAFLDFDDVWYPACLAQVDALLTRTPSARFVLARTDFLKCLGHRFKVLSSGPIGFLNDLPDAEFACWHLLHNFPVGMGSAVFVDRQLLLPGSPYRFDPALSLTTAEDVLFGLRLLERRIRPVYLDEPCAVHRTILGAMSRAYVAYLKVDEKAVKQYIAREATDALYQRVVMALPGKRAEIDAKQRALDLEFDLKLEFSDPSSLFGIRRCLHQSRGWRHLARLWITNLALCLGLGSLLQRAQFGRLVDDPVASERVAALLRRLGSA